MNILHVRPYGFDVGSVYKYRRMLADIADVTDITVPATGNSSTLAALIAGSYDAGLVGGDWWGHHEAFRQHGTPYVLVAHDITTIRMRGYSDNERRMLEGAASVIFTSEEHEDYCASRYRMPPHRTIHLRNTREQIAFKPLPKLPGKHLVYAGGVTAWSQRTGAYGYRSYHRIFAEVMAAGWTVHVYPCYLASAEIIAEYAAIGCVVHDQVPHTELPREMSRYTAGLQAYADERCDPLALAYTKTCRPNKTWDYLAAGIPTIGFNAGNTSALYDGKWGIVLDSLAEFEALSEDDLPSRAKIMRHRSREVMENDAALFAETLSDLTSETAAQTRKEAWERLVTYRAREEFLDRSTGIRHKAGLTVELDGRRAEQALGKRLVEVCHA